MSAKSSLSEAAPQDPSLVKGSIIRTALTDAPRIQLGYPDHSQMCGLRVAPSVPEAIDRALPPLLMRTLDSGFQVALAGQYYREAEEPTEYDNCPDSTICLPLEHQKGFGSEVIPLVAESLVEDNPSGHFEQRAEEAGIPYETAYNISLLLSYAQSAVDHAHQENYDPFTTPTFFPACTRAELNLAWAHLGSPEQSMLPAEDQRSATLLTVAVPVISTLEHYAKQLLRQPDGTTENLPDEIRLIAEQGLLFWSPLLSLRFFENLSSRIADAAYVLLDPQKYRAEMTRLHELFFGTVQTHQYRDSLLSFLPSELQAMLSDPYNPNSLISYLDSFIRDPDIEELLIPPDIAKDIILRIILPAPPQTATEDQLINRRSRLLDLAERVGAGRVSLSQCRKELAEMGQNPEILRPRIHFRLKCLYRAGIKFRSRLQPIPGLHLDETSSLTAIPEYLQRLTHMPEEERTTRLAGGPYLYTDLFGFRVLIPQVPRETDALKFGIALARMGFRVESDVHRLRRPGDRSWPAAHYEILFGFPQGKRSIKVALTLNGDNEVLLNFSGPAEVQLTGTEIVQRSPVHHAGAEPLVTVQPVLVNSAGTTHKIDVQPLRGLSTIYDVLASIYTRLPPDLRPPDFMNFLIHHDVKEVSLTDRGNNAGKRIPMDYQLLPQVYPIRVEDRQHSPEETFHRYDEVIRALPASTPTYAAFATDYFLNTSLFSDSERLGIILRALGIHPYLRESDLTQEDIVRIAHKLTMTCGQAVSSYGQFGTLTSKQWQLLKRQGRSSKQATPAGTQADYITHKGKTTVLDPEAIQSIARLIAQMYLTRFVTPHDLEIAWQSASR